MMPFFRRATRPALALALSALTGLWPAALPAAGLTVELNHTKQTEAGCIGAFLIGNGLGHTLNRFELDLYVFDGKGVAANRLLVNMAPLPADKTTVASFALNAESCGNIARVLLNSIPACQADSGEALDCLSDLSVSSKDGIDLFK